MNKINLFWLRLRSSLWFIPTLFVASAIGLAAFFVYLDTIVKDDLLARFPMLFGASAQGSREMLSVIAGSMITIAGVSFTITIAALAQTSSQYTPRILRTFMRNRPNQIVLGAFVGIFTYCIVVLRTIRSVEESRFVPSLAVLFGVVLAIVGVGFFIFFIHNIARSLQAPSIIASAADETRAAVERIFPKHVGEPPDEPERPVPPLDDVAWRPVLSIKSGYIQNVTSGELLRIAREYQTVVRMELGIGDFVVKGTTIASIAEPARGFEELSSEIGDTYTIGRHRTVEQDAAFGIRQIVDVALKALSPGVNETTTALTCVDYLSSVMTELARRQIPSIYRFDEDDGLRVIAVRDTFEGLLDEAFDAIRRNAEGNVEVLENILVAVETIATATDDPDRRRALIGHVHYVEEAAARRLDAPNDRRLITERVERINAIFGELV